MLTDRIDTALEKVDLVLECSGDAIAATRVVAAAFEAGIPVVTMNAEFHVTVGTYFVGRGLMTEAEGDQPGALAVLAENARSMGFHPLVYGNMKGFLDPEPTRKRMMYWMHRQGLSLPMVTAFTDGTKLQFEQALIANAMGATIAVPGMLGPAGKALENAANILASNATELGTPIADYTLNPSFTHGVFLVATHDTEQQEVLRYLKLGDGPYYILTVPHIFAHMEIARTIHRLLSTGQSLLHNTRRPTIGVASIAKRDLPAHHEIKQGIGGFDIRGIAVKTKDFSNHFPIGLAKGAILRNSVRRGQMLTLDDVDIPPSRAFDAWSTIRNQPLAENEPPRY